MAGMLAILWVSAEGADAPTEALISGIEEYKICDWNSGDLSNKRPSDYSPFIIVQAGEVSFCWERTDVTPPRSIISVPLDKISFVADETKTIPTVKLLFGGGPNIAVKWFTKKNRLKTAPSGIQINISQEDLSSARGKK